MKVAWRQFVMNLGALDPEAVEEIFVRFGASSVTMTDAGDNPVLEPGPGETPLWTDTLITGMFSPDVDLSLFEDKLLDELGLTELPTHRTENLEDRAWEREWLKDFGPMQFGRRLWIHPKGSEPSSDDMLDYGCGSGVLAIAALRLGCETATGMDIDPQALIATRQNANDNNVAEKLTVLGAPDEIRGTFDVVVANILAGPLVQFAESITLTIRERGMLALSGVLCEQADEVMAAYGPWIDFDEPVFKEQDGQEWSRLTGKRRAG